MKLSKFLLTFFFIAFFNFSPSFGQNKSITDSIKSALNYQIKNYPVSQYRDVYKNFMQDFFGPGHLLNDTSASGKYLRSELAEFEVMEGPDYEQTGYQGNFYRVNLRLIKDGTITYDIFFDTFVKSVQGITPPDGETWMSIWNQIDQVIRDMNLHFENEEADRQALAEQFAQNNFIAHHSKTFDENVNFHYRIISKDNFNNIILPIIQKSISKSPQSIHCDI